MTQEEKQLLLKDLCARLPYGVKVNHFDIIKELLEVIPSSENVMIGYDINNYEVSVVEDIKPYLRPISTMTEEEKKELSNIGPYFIDKNDNIIGVQCNSFIQTSECQDWLNEHHFDYRGLISMGLALEAPEGMYKIKSITLEDIKYGADKIVTGAKRVIISPEERKKLDDLMYDEHGWKNIGNGLRIDRDGHIAGGLKCK